MQRRQLLNQSLQAAAYLGGLAAGALVTTPLQSREMAGSAASWRKLANRLVAALPQHQEAALIGRAHLQTLGRTLDPADLVNEIMADPAMSPRVVERGKAHELRAMLQAKNRADFAANSTVLVKGWVFGTTEARLFCLSALI